ncbi:MAG: AAA family ATPase [Bacteroidota bacterium]
MADRQASSPKHATLQLNELTLENYWGIKETTIAFDPELTVLIGANGAGKTAVLDALRKAFQIYEQVFRGHPNVSSKEVFEDSDITNGVRRSGGFSRVRVKVDLDFEEFTSSEQGAGGKPRREASKSTDSEQGINNRPESKQEVTWACNIEPNNSTIDRGETEITQLESYVNSLNRILKADLKEARSASEQTEILRDKANLSAPLVLYFDCSRISSDTFRAPAQFAAGQVEYASIFEAWDGALDRNAFSFEAFFRWFRQQNGKKQQKNQTSREKKLFEAVGEAIYGMFGMGNYLKDMNFSWETEDGEITITNLQGEVVSLFQLSSGEQSLLIIAAILARRLVLANPGRENPVQEGCAIVMIDEIGLHLHPNWQREVIPRLRETFKQVQFIVTTHSPFVVNQVESGNVIILKEGGKAESVREAFPSWNIYGADIYEVLKLIFGMDYMVPTDVQALLTRYHQLITAGNTAKAEEVQQELEQLIDPNHPELLKGKSRMAVQQLDLKL